MSSKDNNLKTAIKQICVSEQQMEFWPENQGQSPLYSKFGTVPGRNCTHNYHDRHQVPHYPLYYGEQQDQGRESSYWTVPGSRTGGAPQEYTNWMDQELTAPTSSHFPFILDRHVQQHQDLGDYQPHEARDREWIAAQRAAREYDRGFLREAWQRRWEPCGPVRYSRDVSAKRSDSSYRELEAWAARYSHSLPRRRRIEAELRGASKGLLESSRAPERDSRSGTDPRVVALQQVRQSANIRESGLWDRGGRQQGPTYYSSQTPATDTSHMLDIKEKTGYQRRMFSQPPGYIAPPPYDSSHKGSPVLHHCDTSWEQEGKRQAYWSQPTPRKHDVSVDLQDHKKGEKEELTKSDGIQRSFPEHRRQESDALHASSPFSIQETHLQYEGMLSLQQPQVLQAVENKKTNEEPSSKVIEGRKFRLNRKTGGMTIFCLVSRIAGTTETPSLPLCTSQTNIQNTELGGVSKGLRDSIGSNQTHKLVDEVDGREPTPTEQSNTSDARNVKAKQKETPTCVESEMLEDNILNKAETDGVVPEKLNTNYADSTCGRQVAESVQPVSVKYPLWREPSITSRAETKSSSKCLKANSEERESDGVHKQEDLSKVNPIDVEVRRLDNETDTDSEDSKVLLVIDTTCVVVKMERIPSPKKEHVHYLHTEHSPLDIQSTVSPECVQSDQNSESNPFQINGRSETKLHSDLIEKKAPEGESKISSFCMSSSSVSERETLEERAERILGIPLDDCITKQQPEDAALLLDSCVEDQEVEPSPVKDNNADDAVEQIPEDTKEEEQSQNQLEVGQTEEAVCLQENDDSKDQATNEGAEDFAGLQVQVSNLSEENDSQLETDIKPSPEIEMTKDPLLKPASEEGTTEQEENHPIENDTSSHHPCKCLSPPSNLSYSSSLSPSPDCEEPNPTLSLMLSSSDLTPLMHISESNIEEGPDPELTALNSAENLALHPETSSLPYTPSPLPPRSNDFSPSSIPHTDHFPSLSPLDLIDQTADAVFSVEDQVKEDDTSQLINNEISDPFEDLAKDMTEELLLQQQFESGQPDDDSCVNESNVTDEQQTEEADKDPTGHTMEQILKISKENAIEVDILQQQLERVLAEDVTSVKESHMTEEQLPKEVDDPTGLLEQTISQQYVTDSQTQTEVNILQQQFDNSQEEVAFLKESDMTEEQSQKEADEEPTGLMEQTLSTENATDSQTQIQINILQDIEPQTKPSNSSPPSTSEESCMTEEQSQKEADEEPTGLMEQTLSTENPTDSQTQIQINILQDIEPQTEPSNSSPPSTSESTSEESDMTEEQSQKEADEEPTGLMEQTLSTENPTDSQTQIQINILQDIEPQTEPSNSSPPSTSESTSEESDMTEEQSQKEADEEPTGLMEQTLSTENPTDSQTQIQINILQDIEPQTEPSNSSPPSTSESTSEESDMTEEQSQKEADEEPTGLMEQTLSTENPTDSQTQIQINILQDIEPQTEPSNSSPPSTSESDCEVSQSPDVLSPSKLSSRRHTSNESDAEFVTLLEMDSVCPPALNPDSAPAAGIPETVPPPLHLDSCEESLQFSYPFCMDSPTELPSSSSSGSVDHDLTLKEEPQYPKSLWDAVNRIRKHTAPDSENEEEEVSELWDPESVVEDLDVIVGMPSERIVFDGAGQQEVSAEGSVGDVEVGQIQADPCHEEPLHAEEDTLSCSSTCSQGSGDTVIVADEDEVEESPPDAGTESKAEGERCFSAKVKDETAAKEEGDNDGDESVTNMSSQREECLVEVANITMQAVEMTETEQEEKEEVVSVPSEVSDEGMIESMSLK
ncbi:NAC-alpha domain-containing protein 1 isoform X2 [Sander lucioperca]|uniref:NAC-alpha domain-containing protein 1 isoform X2 n=1 Tax=Sander lucioperca TaxID=283035 RepID=UPI001653CA25|nr:NAC-alpha domain-containing protein 1 isoform X2 [Sander lucioperca]